MLWSSFLYVFRWRVRQVLMALRRGAQKRVPPHSIDADVNRRMQSIADDRERQGATAVGLRSSVMVAFQIIHQRYENKGALPGLATGFAKLDELMGGFMPGNVIALASEPCTGKSALAAQIAVHRAVQEKQPVCVFSMKRSATEYALRLIAALGSVDRQHLRDGSIDEEEWPGITKAITQLSEAKIIIDATVTQTISSLRSRLHAALEMHAAKLVVIDNLELMHEPDHASDLRTLAREFDASVLVLAQSRGAVDACTRLRDRSLEDHADAMLLLDRDRANGGENARLVVARNRNGRTGAVKLRYVPNFARFESVTS